MNDLKIFENEAFGAVRVVERDGEPWFVASDVARALKYSESSLETIGKLFISVPVEWTDRKQIPVRFENGGEQLREGNSLALTLPGCCVFSPLAFDSAPITSMGLFSKVARPWG